MKASLIIPTFCLVSAVILKLFAIANPLNNSFFLGVEKKPGCRFRNAPISGF